MRLYVVVRDTTCKGCCSHCVLFWLYFEKIRVRLLGLIFFTSHFSCNKILVPLFLLRDLIWFYFALKSTHRTRFLSQFCHTFSCFKPKS